MTFEDVELPADETDPNENVGNRKNTFEYYSGSDTFELIKGQNVVIPDTEKRIKVSFENSYKMDNVEADLFVFLLDGNDRVLSESDLVFFGNTSSLNKSVTMNENGSAVEVRFNKINQDITRVRFIMSFNMEDGRIRNFSMLNDSKVTFLLENQAYSFQMSDVGRFESVSVFEFNRIRNKWKLSIQAAGLKADINSLCADYGIDVE